jgi:LDH2 family malate/lactate/ureidoglycolate dehydrogenase
MFVIQVDELKMFATRLLQAGGFTESEACQTADLLIWANLRGADSHGVLRIPRYIEMVDQGIIKPGSTIRTVREHGVVTVLDCGKSPGAVGMNAASEKAELLARRSGVGWCAARQISHAGAVGYFAAKLARRGLVSLVMTASRPLMSYFGAKGEALSTNPIAICAPGLDDDDPILLDMSTAAAALGKIMVAQDTGQPIPSGWAVDENGVATTDARRAVTMLPMAGAKGSGLSLMIEILVSVLAGSPIIAPVLLSEKKGGFNGLIIAIDPIAFGPREDFDSAIRSLRTAIHGLEPAEGVSAVLLPGERGAMAARKNACEGIALKQGTSQRLAETARRLAVPVPAGLV